MPTIVKNITSGAKVADTQAWSLNRDGVLIMKTCRNIQFDLGLGAMHMGHIDACQMNY